MLVSIISIICVPALTGLFLTLLLQCGRRKSSLHHLPLPPGPKPLPLVGNILDIPTAYQWLTYAEWSKTYGNIVHVKFFGKSLIILGSAKHAFDLFEKRSSLYSDRPMFHMLFLMGFDWAFTLMPYGSWWRRHRRLFHQYFNSTNVAGFESLQVSEVRQLLRNLQEDPENYIRHIRHAMGSLIIRVVYGVKDDELVGVNQRAMESVAQTMNPGSFWVDIMPFLKHIPAWFPGAGFQRKAREWRSDGLAARDMGFAAAKHAISQHDSVAMQSIVADMLERISSLDPMQQKEESEIAEDVAAVSYIAGADTVISSISSFFLAMVHYPEVQAKAYAELMDVVGPHRLPEFADRDSLPYINAIVKESLRWQPVLPLGVAHATIEDDEYEGYLIPKGSIVMANSWAILHDPEEYPDPERFFPDRFVKDGRLNAAVRDPSTAAFGYGRRICPGRYFADNLLFITFASILHAFTINPPLGPDGKPALPDVKMTSGSLSFPVPFNCIIEPRSSLTAALIHD
ncbi:CyP450 monooxygenase [Obba rivulosa]|uniref:CyP450 monooxygenase n=1 Tax=Obba rivulosa TaxID=1052685 RepID=A0A8E2ASQ6_9APHY|nr:CyP450 monooxygenase [Obba rivulosa]